MNFPGVLGRIHNHFRYFLTGIGVRALVVSGLLIVIAAPCGVPNPFTPKMSEISPCDPIGNLYVGDQHYIERDYVTEEGRIDYKKYFRDRKIESSPCDPVSKSQKKRTK